MSHDHTRSNLDPRKDDGNVVGNLVGEGIGGASGIAAGAAVGSLGGPVGTVIGALAGAIGGWWAGRSVAEGVHDFTDDDDKHYRTHYSSANRPLADASPSASTRSYDDVRPAYQLGHIAGRNPDYAGRKFEDVETDLQRGWTGDVAAKHGDWTTVRPYARDAYERGRGMTSGMAGMAGNVGARVGNTLDDMKDRVDGNPASRPGLDSTDSSFRAAGAGPIDRATGTVGNAVDDMKDRVDGNPSSRPGPDTTDRSSR